MIQAVLLGFVSTANEPSPRPRVTRIGRATIGMPVIETIRTVAPQGSWTQTTELVEVSDAPIDPAVFEIPPDYRPALSIWGRGYDFNPRRHVLQSRASGVGTARDFARQFWR